MKLQFQILTFFIALFLSNYSQAQVVYTNHVESELVSEVSTVQAGESFWIALRMNMDENWYIYWQNPGDSGLPVYLAWDKPEGTEIGEINWPPPVLVDVQGLTSYGLYGEVFLMMEATAPDDIEPGSELTLGLVADWLVCEKECIPGDGEYELRLDVTDESPEYNEWLLAFDHARSLWPQENDNFEIVGWQEGNRFVLQINGPEDITSRFEDMWFFSHAEEVTENGGPQELVFDEGIAHLLVEKSMYSRSDVDYLSGLLYSEQGFDESGEQKYIVIEVDLTDAALLDSSPYATAPIGLLLALVFAFIGGLILNLMPCVFPILSIKIMHFVHLGGGDKTVIRNHGFLFAAGVILSFLILAGALIGLRAAGQELGWGFQLQSPIFIAILAFLMFGLALNLLGVFEFGNSIMNVAGKADTGEGYRGAFMTGILATILATPCTAPFMGTALGFAITLPAIEALLIFAVLGIGMATPYVILSLAPGLLDYLPKPGAWMETFKQAMAFPLFATVLWLAWVFGSQVGFDGLFALLIGLLLASIGAWILNRWNVMQISSKERIVTRTLSALLLAGGLYITASTALNADTSSSAKAGTDGYGIQWLPYSAELVSDLREEGRSVFIDFTAAWCITCKANERVVFSSAEVRNKFAELDVAMVKADWTNRNPEITRALAEFNRNGVPLYVLYDGKGNDPKILPELLTPGIVLNALRELESSQLTYSQP